MKELNIILVRQVPNSPDTNVLDLGIWMSLQSAVEKHHRLHRGDREALHATVMQVWDEVTNAEAFEAVFDRLAKNYDIIRQHGGGNTLIEAHRGKAGKVALDSLVAAVAEREEDDADASDVEFEEVDADE